MQRALLNVSIANTFSACTAIGHGSSERCSASGGTPRSSRPDGRLKSRNRVCFCQPSAFESGHMPRSVRGVVFLRFQRCADRARPNAWRGARHDGCGGSARAPPAGVSVSRLPLVCGVAPPRISAVAGLESRGPLASARLPVPTLHSSSPARGGGASPAWLLVFLVHAARRRRRPRPRTGRRMPPRMRARLLFSTPSTASGQPARSGTVRSGPQGGDGCAACDARRRDGGRSPRAPRRSGARARGRDVGRWGACARFGRQPTRSAIAPSASALFPVSRGVARTPRRLAGHASPRAGMNAAACAPRW
jgi:hypothetical protein